MKKNNCKETIKARLDFRKYLVEHGSGSKSDKRDGPIKFSIVMPICNADPKWLHKTIKSVIKQKYTHWELCIIDNGSTNKSASKDLKKVKDSRIKIIHGNKNQGLALALNKAISVATGDFIVLLDPDDELTLDALDQIYQAIHQENAEIVYSDEDKIDARGRLFLPHHKPDYSPDMLLSQNYICHVFCCKKSIIDHIGGFREGFGGSQDYDLILRCVEQTDRIFHIPKVLYHCRSIPTSGSEFSHIAEDTWNSGVKAVGSALSRRKIEGNIIKGEYFSTYRVIRKIHGTPLVSIIICFKDKPDLLIRCIHSIKEKTEYPNYEIIGISNNSTEKETITAMEELRSKNIHFYEYNIEFNYSTLNNYGVSLAKGEHIVLMNNDIELITTGWLETLLEHSQRPEIGAVGAKLYYPDDTIQHAGVIIGINIIAGHVHRHQSRASIGYFARPSLIQNLSAVTAALLMVKKRLYESIEGLDEKNLEVSFNDIDFCLKLREKGYLNIFTPYCEAYHLESVSRGKFDTPEKRKVRHIKVQYMKKRHKQILTEGDPYYNPNLTLSGEDFSLKNFKTKNHTFGFRMMYEIKSRLLQTPVVNKKLSWLAYLGNRVRVFCITSFKRIRENIVVKKRQLYLLYIVGRIDWPTYMKLNPGLKRERIRSIEDAKKYYPDTSRSDLYVVPWKGELTEKDLQKMHRYKIEHKEGSRSRVINTIIKERGYSSYLEIGVFKKEHNFDKIIIDKKTSVDPGIEGYSEAIHTMTSDEFFTINEEKFDIVFIDGLHEHSQVSIDIYNALKCLNENGTILCHDMNPLIEWSQLVPRKSIYWNGDSWKAFVELRMTRDDLEMFVVDVDHGVGIICKGAQTKIKKAKLTYKNLRKQRNNWLNLISLEEFEEKEGMKHISK